MIRNIFKLGSISLVVLFAMVTAMSLLIPSHIRLSKAVNIKGGKEPIFTLIKDTVRWKEWHPAFADSNAKYMAGVSVQWLTQNDSELIARQTQGTRRTLINGWQIHSFPASDSLALQWYIDFNLPWYPWQKFSSLFYENTYGSMMEHGLANIRQIVEK